MKQKTFYKGYYLAPMAVPQDSGMYEARIAIVAMGGDRTRAQRFLDLDEYPTRDEADAAAIEAAREWVDRQTVFESRAHVQPPVVSAPPRPEPTAFAELS